MIVTILTDTPDSWILPWAENLQTILRVTGAHQVNRVTDAKDILPGDVAFFLGCTKIVPKETLARNKFNMVPHPSNLPNGKGFSPLAWQILEGNNEISMALFDAVEELDAGDIYLEETMHFDEGELNDEIKNKQGIMTVSICLKFMLNLNNLQAVKQKGPGTFYPRRTQNDSELNVNKTIKEQFNLLRVVDNDRYPAFFSLHGSRYEIKIKKIF